MQCGSIDAQRERAERDRDVSERALRQRIEELERLLAERRAR